MNEYLKYNAAELILYILIHTHLDFLQNAKVHLYFNQ